ncbi:MAG: hypothetical protein EP340_06780 [Alphaproteobacteria bacterium]|nr:MAG: hypothetical protein EP340_06780 [Alphaproteobacteria bacterium]
MFSNIIWLVWVGLSIWAVYNIALSNAEMPMKIVWCLVAILLGPIGVAIWFFAGPKKA